MRSTTYIKVGFFLLFAIALVLVGVLFLKGGALKNEKGFYAETYFEGSVQGVSIGAPVKYRGIPIGEVTRISFAWSDYRKDVDPELSDRAFRYARIVFKINQENLRMTNRDPDKRVFRAQVNQGLRIQMKSQGITGLAYLDLDYIKDAPEALPVPWEPEYSYIPSVPSLGETIVDTVRNLSGEVRKLGQFAEDVSALVRHTDELLQAVSPALMETIENCRIVSKDLTEAVRDFREHPIGFLTQPQEAGWEAPDME